MKLKIHILLFIIPLAALFSCAQDENGDRRPEERTGTMELILGRDLVVENSDRINSIRVIVFDDASDPSANLDLNLVVPLQQPGPSPGSPYTIPLQVSTNPDKMVVVIANEPAALSDQLSAITQPWALEDMRYQFAQFFNDAANDHYTLSATGMPMSGVVRGISVSSANDISNPKQTSLTLERVLARVDLCLKMEPGASVTLDPGATVVRLSRTYTAGHLVAGSSIDGTRDWNQPPAVTNFGHLQTVEPSELSSVSWSPSQPIAISESDGVVRICSFYTPERTCDAAANQDKLILSWENIGTSNGHTTLNSFSGPDGAQTPQPLTIIRRNNVYRITGNVKKSGIETSISVLDWKDAAIETEIERPYFLSLSDNEVIERISNRYSEKQYITVNTDRTTGWTSAIYTDKECTTAQTDGWLTIAPSSSTAPGAKELTLSFKDTEEDTRFVKFTAGRKSIVIKVEHSSLARKFAVSNIVHQTGTAGSRLTFATSREDANNNKLYANALGIQFKWGSLVAVEPYGAPNSTTSNFSSARVTFKPSEYTPAISQWDQIPSMTPNGPSYDDPSRDEFMRTFENGFDASQGIGDICRYISAQGWVQGDWRMPTIAEMQYLASEGLGQLPFNMGGDPNFNVNTRYGKQVSYIGRSFGPGEVETSAHLLAPPEDALVIVHTGYRDETNGKFGATDYTYLWSSTPARTQAYSLSFKGTVNSTDPLRFVGMNPQRAHSVRCIMDD